MQGPGKIGYFSMEIALEAALPTYSGGLGVLAGDTRCGGLFLYAPGDMRFVG